MGTLAEMLDGTGNAKLSVEAVLEKLEGDDRDAFLRALFDKVDVRHYRVSAPDLARLMADAGYPVSELTLAGYRRRCASRDAVGNR